MTEFTYLCNHSGAWAFTDKKTGEAKSGISYYLILVKKDNCKPAVYKCSESAYRESCELKPHTTINLFFDENQTVSAFKPV